MCSGIEGGPACVRACPTGAAIRVAPERFLTVSQAREGGRLRWLHGGYSNSRHVTSQHEGFLRHAGFRWLKIALTVSLLAIVIYAFDDVQPRPNGGSWYGYTLGTIGAAADPVADHARRAQAGDDDAGAGR